MKLITLAERYNYICHYCHRKFPLEELTRDHYNPLNKGRHRGTGKGGSKTGWRLACKGCNLQKGNLPGWFFEKILSENNKLT